MYVPQVIDVLEAQEIKETGSEGLAPWRQGSARVFLKAVPIIDPTTNAPMDTSFSEISLSGYGTELAASHPVVAPVWKGGRGTVSNPIPTVLE